jgi:hypothetical protein
LLGLFCPDLVFDVPERLIDLRQTLFEDGDLGGGMHGNVNLHREQLQLFIDIRQSCRVLQSARLDFENRHLVDQFTPRQKHLRRFHFALPAGCIRSMSASWIS